MRAIVINRCYGGFSLSQAAKELLAQRKNISMEKFNIFDIKRYDKDLVAVVRELGAEANSEHSDLKIVEIPEDVKWYIDEYDGIEVVHEFHRSWY
jgi:hypothetical protein